MKLRPCLTLQVLFVLFHGVRATFLSRFFTDPASLRSKDVDEGFNRLELEPTRDVTHQRGLELLRFQRPLIYKIEVDITTGRELQRNLTSMRDFLVYEMERMGSRQERSEIEHRIRKIEILLNQVRARTDETELRFRDFLRRVSTGEIRSGTECQTLLQAIWSGYHKSIRNLVDHSAGFLTSIVHGVTGALANLGMGILDYYRLKFQPLELAIDALTGKGSFHKPIRGIIGRR